MSSTIGDFRPAAKRTFQALDTCLSDPNYRVYWRLGHACDTAFDYLIQLNDHNVALPFAKTAFDAYKRGDDADWYDDYGWWGIAGLKASRRPQLFGDWTGKFQDEVASPCWTTMHSKAPWVWDRAKNDADYKDLAPRFAGGVWNMDFSHSCDPHKGGLCGFQNTVTNGLYLLLATRLCVLRTRQEYCDAGDDEYRFLRSWLGVTPGTDALLNYYRGPAANAAVVRERVSTYAETTKRVSDYRPTLAWAGDQGLILGGLVARMLLVQKDSPQYKEMLGFARSILAGIREYMVDPNGILQSWMEHDHKGPPGGDPGSYSTGVGACMRYLLYAFENNQDLKATLSTPEYQKFVRSNAEHVVQSPSDDPDKVVGLTNDLATLVAAIGMLPSE